MILVDQVGSVAVLKLESSIVLLKYEWYKCI